MGDSMCYPCYLATLVCIGPFSCRSSPYRSNRCYLSVAGLDSLSYQMF